MTYWAFCFCWLVAATAFVAATIADESDDAMLWLLAMFICWVGTRVERKAGR